MKTIITWLKRAAMLSVTVAFAAAGFGANAATSSGLVHRWSFNGSLEDTVGGATAVTNGACSFTEDGKGVTLAGGSKGTSFITLGACSGILPSKSLTLEIWATQDAVQNWSRIFDFGNGENNYLTMTWTRGTTLSQDCTEVRLNYSNLISVSDTMQSYALGKKWHISLTVSCNADGTSTLRWAKRDAATGAIAASGSAVTSQAWTPASLSSGSCYLGHSQYNDNDASATYDEVRIWNRVLSNAELDANAAAGPDGVMGDIMPTPAVTELPHSTDYVQDGLLAHWDAIDNSIVDGVRVHDDNAATWTDLTGNGHNFPVADYIGSQLNGWTATSLDAKSCYDIPSEVACTNYVTLEICARHNAADAIFFNSGDGGNKFAAYYIGRLQFYNYAPYQTIGNQAKTFQAAAVHSPDVSRPDVYTNAVAVASTGSDSWSSLGTNPVTTLGSGSDYYRFGGEYYAIRLYDRALTEDEIAQNAKLDAMRYLGDRSVESLDDALKVAGSPIAIGAATPAYGISLGHGASDTIACSVPATVTVGETRASCTGYTVTTNGAAYAQGDTASFTLQHPGVATRVEWQWSAEYNVVATAGEGGSVSIAKQWFAPGETATITATPDEGYVFVAWLGALPEAKRRDAALELEVASPVAVTAVFAPADVFTSETVFYNGETEQGDYAIVTPEQLRLFHDRTTVGTTYEGSTFHILADIDLDGQSWSPCGTFSGVLDGHGHAIRNINISNNSNTGLFSIINGATVRNLSLRGGKMVMNAYNCIGGITGRVQGQSCVIEDCTVDLEILSRSTSDGTWVGGIVGVVEAELTLSRCRSLCAVTADDNYAYSRIGGLVGNAKAGLTIEGCYASGSVQGSCFSYGNSYAGGILGCRDGGTVVISNSYWTAENRFNFNADTHTVGRYEENCTIVDTPAILDNFPKNTFNVRTRGNGTGTAAYVNGEFVATPDEGSVFIRWEGLPPKEGDYNETTVWAVFGETVSSYDEFMAMNRAGFYVQTEDIDMADVANFEGHSNYRHYGYYDGGNHEIRNMSCPNGRGMFGSLICAEIKNLRIVNPLVGTNCYGHKGVLAQYAESSRISNVHVEGGSVLGRDNNPAGGLVAEGNCGIIEDCSSSAAVGSEVTGWGPGTGGLVGKVRYGMTLRRCRAAGDVTGAGYNIGGLVGYADNGVFEECMSSSTVQGPSILGGLIGAGGSATVRRCCATGAVTGGTYVGGFIGNGDFMSFTDCCALGSVTATNGDYYAGGFVAGDGAWGAYLAFTNCYSTGAVSGETNSGGFDSASRSSDRNCTGCYWDTEASGKDSTYVAGATGLATAEMQSGVAFDGWDATVWKFTAGMYPRLRAFIPKYAVTWLDDDGETVIKEELVDEFDLPACDTPEKAATPKYTYTFAGWDPEVVAVTGEATYTATYNATINKYTITWKNDDGTTLDSESVEYDATPAHADPVKAATPKFTYTFAGWNPEVATVTGEATYTATYDATINEYTITWKNDDGTVLDSEEVAYDETPTHADPTKASTAQYHYEFAGWSPAVSTVAGEATYTATFNSILRSYTITWKDDAGAVIDTTTVNYGTTPSHAVPTKASTAQYDYTFAGWGNVVEVSGEATYQATFTPVLRSYTVSWVVEGETVASGLVAYGTTPAYGGATPVKESTAEYDYTFAGWGNVVAVTGAATYTATFNATKRSYTITWANIDGAGASATSTVEYGTTPAYGGATPTKAETAEYTYTFAGWDKTVVAVTGAATYTATFNATKRSYTITWLNEGGAVLASGDVEYGTVPAYGGATPTKADDAEYTYTFAGWTPAVVAVTGAATYTATFDATSKEPEDEFAGYIKIGDVAGFETIADNLATNYVLTADIDLQNVERQPFGTFSGVLDGNGHTIRNLNIKRNDSKCALFSHLNGATIRNLTLQDGKIEIEGNNSDAAGIAGHVQNGALIEDCTVDGLEIISKNLTAGGFVGYAESGNLIIRRCRSLALITANGSDSAAGGFVGYTDANVQIEDCYYSGVITAGRYAGGIVGQKYYGAIAISNCYHNSCLYPDTNNDRKLVGNGDGNATITGNPTIIDILPKGGVRLVVTGGGSGTAAYVNDEIVATPAVGSFYAGYIGMIPEGAFNDVTVWAVFGKEIATVGEFSAITNNLAGVYKLTADIDLQNVERQPFGEFSGVFDGNGYAIKNISITKGSDTNIGLFSLLNGATIRNLTLDGGRIEGYDNAGGIAGKILGDTLIENCSVNLEVFGNRYTIGGFVGYADGGNVTFRRCRSFADVTSVSGESGGLVGATNSDNLRFEDCYAEGMLVARNQAYCGGSTGYSGGLVGLKDNGGSLTISNCYHRATMVDNGFNDRQLVGNGDDKATITGVPSADADLTSGVPFEGWDTTVWKFTEGLYPRLRVFIPQYTVTWLDEDGVTVLDEAQVDEFDTPVYEGASPAKAATAQYTYTFAGWAPAVVAVTGAATYTAQFNATPKVDDGTVDLSTITGNYTAQDGETLTGATGYEITIAAGATVTLDGVAIMHTSGSGRAAIDCAGNATIVLAEDSENFVSNLVDNCAAIHPANNATLTIRGSGSLDAYSSGDYGAGIGAASATSNSSPYPCGNIVIEGGTITATGGYAAAGVGAAAWSSPCGDITITSNAVVTATGGAWGAGVGAASDSSPCGDITISGNASVTATSTAQSYAHAAGIGAADYSQCGSIVISTTGTVESQGIDAAGIGADRASCSGITITGGTITATGGSEASAIGASIYAGCGDILISGGTITATGGANCPGVGTLGETASITITGGNVTSIGGSNSSRQNGGAGIGSTYDRQCGDITISGGTVKAKGGAWAAGIGTGYKGICGNITISGGTVTANVCTSTDDKQTDTAAIGAGCRGTCGNILISGGTVVADAHNPQSEDYDNCCAIGATYVNGKCGTITVTDGITSLAATKGATAQRHIGQGDGTATVGKVTISPRLAQSFSIDGLTLTLTPLDVPETVTITWVDEDGTTLVTDTVAYGTTPAYGGETPTKAADAQYTYTFEGWTPAVGAATSNTTYTATFSGTLRSYTVSWVVEGATVASGVVEYGTMPEYGGDTPTKESTAEYDYEFTGWSPAVAAVADDATYTAQFSQTKRSYTVSWVVEGVTVASGSVEYGATPVCDGDTPTKESTAEYSYAFTGWSPAVAAVTGDATYTAQFSQTKRSYMVSWVVEGMTVASGTVEYGQTPAYGGDTPTKESTAEYSYEFSGWSPTISAVTGEATYTAQFEATKRSYTVSWVVEGVTVASGTVEYGQTPEYGGDTPAKASTAEYSYEFTGWSPAIAAVTDDATYTAQFSQTKRSYTVSWVVEGVTVASGSVEYGATPVYDGDTPTKASTAEYSYEFSGWSPAVSAVTGDATYTAQFEATKRSYTVSWVVDGVTVASGTVEYGQMPAYGGDTPTKPETAEYTYTFNGWTPAIAAVTDDATYTAQFSRTKRTYTVSWVVEGATVASGTVEYGTTPIYGGDTPTKPETAEYTYTFNGWTPAIAAVTDDATYTAQFSQTKRSYTVSWVVEGVTVASGSVEYGTTPVYNGATPTKPEDENYTYTFNGWTPTVVTVTDDATYTATFTATPKEPIEEQGEKWWMAVDLRTGATSYFDYDFDTATNTFNTTEYKTVKMAFRKVPRGKYFVQEGLKTATMAKDFYIALFETTAAQYQLMLDPSADVTGVSTDAKSGVSWIDLRGTTDVTPQGYVENGWNPVIYKLNQLTGLKFDLPTVAMWEVASLAKPTNATATASWPWFFGPTIDALEEYAWTENNRTEGCPLPVGMFKLNEWGLYDVYGNVWEWCADGVGFDWSDPSQTLLDTWEWSQTPNGIKRDYHSDYRRFVGGAAWSSTNCCNSVYIDAALRAGVYYSLIGFRLALIVDDGDGLPDYLTTGGSAKWYAEGDDGVEPGAWRSGAIGNRKTTWIETTVTGPCIVSFQWKVSSEERDDKLHMTVDDEEYEPISGFTDWANVSITLRDTGSHTIRWTYVKYSGTSCGEDCGWVKDFTVTPKEPENPDEPDEPTELPDYVTTGGDAEWYVEGNDGVEPGAWRSGAIGHSNSTWIETTVTGPCLVSFQWRVSSEEGYDKLLLTVDGEERDPISGSADWDNVSLTFRDAGSHTIRWTYLKDSSASNGEDCGWVKDFTATPKEFATYTVTWKNWDGTVLDTDSVLEDDMPEYTGTTPTRPKDDEYTYVFNGWSPDIVAATGNVEYTATYTALPNLPASVTTGGDAEWFVDTDGSWRSGTIMNSQETWIETTVTGPCLVTFSWKASSEGGDYDMLALAVDGEEKDSIGGVMSDWVEYSLPIPESGAHTVRWKYFKDDSAWEGEDCGWVKDFTATPKTFTSYTVTWKNWDGTVLGEDSVVEGFMPQYRGETPARETDEDYYYDFAGWTPDIVAADADTIYMATYNAHQARFEMIMDGTTVTGYIGIVPKHITLADWPEGVTAIADDVFSGYSHVGTYTLESVEIPATVQMIGQRAFYSSYGLTNLVFEAGGTQPLEIGFAAFSFAYALESVTLPERLASIADSGFYQAAKLAAVTFLGGRENVTIGRSAFSGTPWWNSLPFKMIADANGDIYAYEGTVPEVIGLGDWPAGATSIGVGVFSGSMGLKDLTIPATITSVGWASFQSCGSLTNVLFAAAGDSPSPLEIAKNAFANCGELVSVTFREGTATIGEGAFFEDVKLAEVNFPASGAEGIDIDDTAFVSTAYASTMPFRLIMDSSNSIIGYLGTCPATIRASDWPVGAAGMNGDIFAGCASLEHITFPAGMQYIGFRAFADCANLATVNFANCAETLNTIGGFAFAGCTRLEAVELAGDGLYVDQYAFQGCTSLAALTLQPGVGRVDSYAFADCTRLEAFVNNSEAFIDGTAFINTGYYRNMPFEWIVDTDEWSGERIIIGNRGVCPAQINAEDWPENIQVINRRSFTFNSDIRAVVFPESLTRIDESAFACCTNLVSITFPTNNLNGGLGVEHNAFALCTKLQNLTLRGALTVNMDAFAGCSSLETVIVEKGVLEIDGGAFARTKLRSIVLPEDMDYVDEAAFASGDNNVTVYLPRTVMNVDNYHSPGEMYDLVSGNVTYEYMPRIFGLETEEGWARYGLVVKETTTRMSLQIYCRVTLDLAGGTGVATKQLGVGDFVNDQFPHPVREGYTFAGWTSERVPYIYPETPWNPVLGINTRMDVTLTALWTPNEEPEPPEIVIDDVNDEVKDKVEDVVVDNETGVRMVAAKPGETFSPEEASCILIKSPINRDIDITAAYRKTIVDNNSKIVIELATPEVEPVAEEENKEAEDATGLLEDVAKVDDEKIAAMPEPDVSDPDPEKREEVGALPIKMYPGLYYQASWGDDLNAMTQGVKFRADGVQTHIGVIKQTGTRGFYKISVSER